MDRATTLEVEKGSSPADLQRQFRDRVGYDYLGHRFLYFEPQGALAWENLIKTGYEQDLWLAGVRACAQKWLDRGGPLAQALRSGRPHRARGVDLVSLGSGEGPKEVLLLDVLAQAEDRQASRHDWVTYVPVDVSIPLLLEAARATRRWLDDDPAERNRRYLSHRGRWQGPSR